MNDYQRIMNSSQFKYTVLILAAVLFFLTTGGKLLGEDKAARSLTLRPKTIQTLANKKKDLPIRAKRMLVRPPFKHTFGFYSVRAYHVPMFLGASKKLSSPKGIVAVRLDEYEEKKKGKSSELTAYGVNSGFGEIFYNRSMISAEWLGEGQGGIWKLSNADGIAAMSDGSVAVAEGGAGRVLLFKNSGGDLRFTGTVGDRGESSQRLSHPTGVALDTEGTIYVTDRDAGLLKVYDKAGNWVRTNGVFDRPGGIAVVDKHEKWLYHKKSYIFLVDGGGERISRLDMDGKTDVKVEGKDFGSPEARFRNLAVDYYGQVWATDTGESAIYKFDSSLDYIATFGSEGESGEGYFFHPWGITIWKKYGQLFVTQENGAEYYWIGIDLLSSDAQSDEDGSVSFRMEFSEPPMVDLKISKNRKTVRTLLESERIRSRTFKVEWDGNGDDGKELPKGDYILEIEASATYSSRKHFKIEKELPFEKNGNTQGAGRVEVERIGDQKADGKDGQD